MTDSERGTPEEISVQTIVPNLPAEAAIKRVDSAEGVTTNNVRVVGYPKFLFDYCCSLERVFFSNREVPLSITVDGITGGRLRNDTYPELETRMLPKEALLQPRLTRGDAVENALSVVRKYLSFHYPTYMLMSGMPDAEILQEDIAYHLYWLIPETSSKAGSQTVIIADSVSGEIVEKGLQIDQVTGSDFT